MDNSKKQFAMLETIDTGIVVEAKIACVQDGIGTRLMG